MIVFMVQHYTGHYTDLYLISTVRLQFYWAPIYRAPRLENRKQMAHDSRQAIKFTYECLQDNDLGISTGLFL